MLKSRDDLPVVSLKSVYNNIKNKNVPHASNTSVDIRQDSTCDFVVSQSDLSIKQNYSTLDTRAVSKLSNDRMTDNTRMTNKSGNNLEFSHAKFSDNGKENVIDINEMTKTILGENSKFEGKQNIPDRYNVYKNSKFGKTSKNHSFTSEGAFEQVLVFILKSGYLQEEDKSSLLGVHVLFDHLNKMME